MVTSQNTLNILAIGDSYMPSAVFRTAFASIAAEHDVAFADVEPQGGGGHDAPLESTIAEYDGTPEQVVPLLAGVEVLAIHGAPLTRAAIDAAPALRLVGCARGGPVNVDVAALSERGIPLVTTPGKNAQAVADQTLGFMIMLARLFPAAQRFIEQGNRLASNFDGARFLGRDLGGRTLGLVGFGQVGHRVARRAASFGMRILVFDPYVDLRGLADVEQVPDLATLLAASDFVSLHARATRENAGMFDAGAFAQMKAGAFFVNTAREALVDEQALGQALASNHLGGAALDVFQPSPEGVRHPLLQHANVVLTPHVGGATHDTLLRGAQMLAEEVRRFAGGEALVNVFNRADVEQPAHPRAAAPLSVPTRAPGEHRA